eukprot:gene10157-2577_t
MTEKLRIGVVGTGWGTDVICPIFLSLGIEITALWGRNEEKTKKISEKLKIPFHTTDYSEFVNHKNIDLIFIVSPPEAHLPMVKEALVSGRHVICDKPPALNLNEMKEMYNLSKKCSSQLSLMDHELRCLPTIIEMKKMIKSGKIGEIIQMETQFDTFWDPNRNYSWWFDESKSGGIFNAIGSHLIDILTHLSEKKIISLIADFKSFKKERLDLSDSTMKKVTSDEYCALILNYEDNIKSIMKINSYAHKDTSVLRMNIIINGTEGSLRYENGHLCGYRNQNLFLEMKDEYNDVLKNSFSLGTKYFGEALKKNFSDDKFDIKDISGNFETALYVQSVLDAAKKSNAEKKWISINYF